MLDFHVIQLSDKTWINELLAKSDFRGCEYCFANNFAWCRLYQTQITRYKDFYISCSFKNSENLYFTFPAGSGDYKDVFTQMNQTAKEHSSPLIIGSVKPEQFAIFDEVFGKGSYDVATDEGSWDYIYLASDLATLSGRKYHGKRNHLKKLESQGYEYTPITESDFDDCLTFAVNGFNENDGYTNESSVGEQYAINRFFEHYHELDLIGGKIKQNGKIIAFTIGERINSDTLGVHIEKAVANIDGAYPAINNEFVKANINGFTYVNREEDLGLEGLRKAKKSYHPIMMGEKYVVKIK